MFRGAFNKRLRGCLGEYLGGCLVGRLGEYLGGRLIGCLGGRLKECLGGCLIGRLGEYLGESAAQILMKRARFSMNFMFEPFCADSGTNMNLQALVLRQPNSSITCKGRIEQYRLHSIRNLTRFPRMHVQRRTAWGNS